MNRMLIINKIIDGKSNRVRESYFLNNHTELFEIINTFSTNIENISFKERLWYWSNDINKEHFCKCGKNTSFNKNWLDGYRKFCSPKCAQNEENTKKKRKETVIDRYGVDNIAKLEKTKKKQESTNIKKYGHKSSFQNENVKKKWKSTINKKYGVDHISQIEDVKLKIRNTNLIKYNKEHYSQTEEYKIKANKTNNEKYGVDWFIQSMLYKEKSKKTNLLKYNKEHYSQTEEYKVKVNKTNNEKYGVDWYITSKDFVNKSIETNIDKRGVTHHTKSEEYIKKVKEVKEWLFQTEEFKKQNKLRNIKKYGVDHYSKTDKFKEDVINTSMLRYNLSNYAKSEESKEKYRKTNVRKYNTDNISKNEEYRFNNYEISKDNLYLNYISNSISLFNCDCNKEHTFEIHIDNYVKRKKANIPICTICYPISDNSSIKEKELFKFIEENYEGTIINNHRDGLEIDIYLPDIKIGFEFNGLYWHSSKFKDKDYHSNKTNHFKDKGIRIIHIWEDDWIERNSIIKSQILNLLGLSKNTIYARKCHIKEVNSKECTKFLNKNHIQGKANSTVKIGLFYDDVIISLMTFDKFEGRNKMNEYEWNLNRFCNRINTNVVGGASKLLSYFIKKYNSDRIISYADNDWSIGDLYYKLGFSKISSSKSDYKYLINEKRVHKSNYKKSITKTLLTESEYAINNNLYKIYDCGKTKFQLKKL